MTESRIIIHSTRNRFSINDSELLSVNGMQARGLLCHPPPVHEEACALGLFFFLMQHCSNQSIMPGFCYDYGHVTGVVLERGECMSLSQRTQKIRTTTWMASVP